jgi:hypothetical protein
MLKLITTNMKINFTKNRIFLICILIILISAGCSGTKDMQERKNLMIPKKSDLPRNAKYKEPKKRKTYAIKHKKRKKKKKSKYY